VHLLVWDYSVLYALEREPFPTVSLRWRTPRGIRFCLDDDLPVGASHHQKIVASLTGSLLPVKTIGMVAVAALAANTDGSPPVATMTASWRLTSSAASAGRRS
jgi:hypothetical protein